MKKLKCFLTLILLFFITGCSNYNMTMKIDKDKSMIYTVTILSNGYNSTLANNISIYKEKYEQYGYSVKEYNQDNKYGMVISKVFDNIDDIAQGKRSDEFNLLYLYEIGYNADIESKMFNVDKGIATNRYAANFYIDLSNLEINLNNATVTYNVELPNGTLSNNANYVSNDNKTLTWNITSLGKTEIDYVFELKSYDTIYYGIAIFIALFLFFSIISNLFSKGDESRENKKRIYNAQKNNNNDINKKIENLTNNAIKNSTNNNASNNNMKTNNNSTNSVNPVKNAAPAPSSIDVIPPTVIPANKNVETKDDMTSFKTPINQKNGGLFVNFGVNKNQPKKIEPVKVNDNEEFNMMINNINSNSNDNTNDISEINSNNDEQIPNPFGNTNLNNVTNINGNSNETNTSDLYSAPVISNDFKINNIELNNNNNFDSATDNEIIKIEPIYSYDANANVNINVSNENSDIANKDIANENTSSDVEVNKEDITFQSLNNIDANAPVIRVNSKSVVVDTRKKEE